MTNPTNKHILLQELRTNFSLSAIKNHIIFYFKIWEMERKEKNLENRITGKVKKQNGKLLAITLITIDIE